MGSGLQDWKCAYCHNRHRGDEDGADGPLCRGKGGGKAVITIVSMMVLLSAVRRAINMGKWMEHGYVMLVMWRCVLAERGLRRENETRK